MTIHNVASQLHSLSVGGYFNGEKFSVRRLENYIRAMLRTDNRLVMEIALPDGRWMFSIYRYSDKADGYDYTIPDNRLQESAIKAIVGL